MMFSRRKLITDTVGIGLAASLPASRSPKVALTGSQLELAEMIQEVTDNLNALPVFLRGFATTEGFDALRYSTAHRVQPAFNMAEAHLVNCISELRNPTEPGMDLAQIYDTSNQLDTIADFISECRKYENSPPIDPKKMRINDLIEMRRTLWSLGGGCNTIEKWIPKIPLLKQAWDRVVNSTTAQTDGPSFSSISYKILGELGRPGERTKPKLRYSSLEELFGEAAQEHSPSERTLRTPNHGEIGNLFGKESYALSPFEVELGVYILQCFYGSSLSGEISDVVADTLIEDDRSRLSAELISSIEGTENGVSGTLVVGISSDRMRVGSPQPTLFDILISRYFSVTKLSSDESNVGFPWRIQLLREAIVGADGEGEALALMQLMSEFSYRLTGVAAHSTENNFRRDEEAMPLQ